MANPPQLYLLADHIKLSLLERQRAISLSLEPNTQDGNISRSLDSMREGIEAAEQEAARLDSTDSAKSQDLREQTTRLRSQYDDLTSQFRGFPTPSITTPNTASLATDFASAQSHRARTTAPPSPSSLKRSPAPAPSASPHTNTLKSVRFTDHPRSTPDSDPNPDPEHKARRAALFPYRDNPDGPAPPDHRTLDNGQIHAYHQQVLQQQDEQLDRLGDSIGRQRDLSIQIGDELDEHVQMLDEVDGHVDRHQGRLDGARKSLGRVARKAGDNKQLTAIFVLIVVLVVLIAVLK